MSASSDAAVNLCGFTITALYTYHIYDAPHEMCFRTYADSVAFRASDMRTSLFADKAFNSISKAERKVLCP